MTAAPRGDRWLRIQSFLQTIVAVAGLTTFAHATDAKPVTWSPTLAMQVKRIGSVQVSPDGKHAAFAVRQAMMEGDLSEFRTHVHLASADGSQSRQLTQGDKSCDDPQWSPDGAWIAFVSARSGKKNLWAVRPDGGEAIQLTDLKSDVGSFRWSPAGDSLALTAIDPPTDDDETKTRQKNDAKVIDENVRLIRLHLVDFKPLAHDIPKSRQLTAGTLSIVSESRAGRTGYDWSPDGKTLVVCHAKSPRPDDWTSADLSLVDVATGTVSPLVHSKSAETIPLYSPDGKSIAYAASDDPPTWGGARRIHVIPAAGGTAVKLADTFDGFGRHSDLVGWSQDGSRLYFTEIRGTAMWLAELPLQGDPRPTSCWGGTPPAGTSVGGYSLNSTRTHFGFGWEGLDQPPEAYVVPVPGFDPHAVSAIHAGLPKMESGFTEVVQWKSTDGLEIEGLLTLPANYKKGQRCPLLLIVHGGPMGVFMQTFDGNPGTYPVAAFAARGYAVLRPNPRGSSGYGRKFRYANYGDWGGGDFRDVMAGVDHVIAEGIADPDRLGVMGWSYGGFMTSWTITQTKRFRAASVGAGVTNLMSFTGTADIPGFLPDYFGDEYWNNLDTYRSHSAMFQIKGVTTPTLIQHGEKDERVPLSQGQELYNALKRQGCTTRMIVYPRTPHGIEEPRLLLDCMNRNLEWFDGYVLNPTKPLPKAAD
jgi:dipeptidyl aminopeptidase/acylaminoacyl peptidase